MRAPLPRRASAISLCVTLLVSCAGEPPPRDETRGHTGRAAESHEPGHDATHVDLPREARRTILLDTARVRLEPIRAEIQATGEIKPNAYRLAHVSPRIAGKAIEVSGVLGQEVEAGESLALLDSLELGQRKSSFLQARANLEVARRNYDREARLFEEKISSEREYLEAKNDFERGEAAYQAAREALRLVGLSQADIDAIQWGTDDDRRLSYFPLVAPFAGTVIERHITIGELVSPDSKPFTIADLGTVWVLLDVYEKDLAHLREGAPARVSVDAYPDEQFAGKVLYVSRQVDPSTRTIEARIEVENQDGRLRPGMFARAVIGSTEADGGEALVIPRDAVQRIRGESVVFVADEEGDFEPRKVALGREAGNEVEILSGLSEGERVVTEGAFYLKSTMLKEEMSDHEH